MLSVKIVGGCNNACKTLTTYSTYLLSFVNLLRTVLLMFIYLWIISVLFMATNGYKNQSATYYAMQLIITRVHSIRCLFSMTYEIILLL